MADTLRANYQGIGATLYAVIRRALDSYVWNGSAFVAWADADIASYDIPLTDAGGDLYTAAFPDIAVGSYSVFYYERAGGSPALTDLLLGRDDVYWNGTTAEDDDPDVTISDYALTTLTAVKLHMGITSAANDDKLTQLINGVSAEIERIVGRQFKARNYRERVNGGWQRRLVLPQSPVQKVTRIAYGIANALSVAYSGAAIDATATVYDDPESPAGGGLRLVTITAAGVETENNLSFSTYPTVSTLRTAVNLISGWTATTQSDVRTLELHPTGGEDAKSRTVTFTYPDQRINTYRLDGKMATVEFDRNAPFNRGWSDGFCGTSVFPKDFQGIVAEYRAGYETIPANVAMVANDLVKEAFMLSTANTGVARASLGPYFVMFNENQAQHVRERLVSYMSGAAFVGGLV